MLNFQDYSSKDEMLSSLDAWVSSGKVSIKEIKISVLFWLRAHSYREKILISFISLNSTRKGQKKETNNPQFILKNKTQKNKIRRKIKPLIRQKKNNN